MWCLKKSSRRLFTGESEDTVQEFLVSCRLALESRCNTLHVDTIQMEESGAVVFAEHLDGVEGIDDTNHGERKGRIHARKMLCGFHL